MALKTEQLALINNLTYTEGCSPIPSIYDYEGMTVQDYLQDYYAKQSQIADHTDYSTFTDGQEWSQVMRAVSNDPELCSLKISSVYHDKGMGDRALVFTDSANSEAIVAYRGTGSKEWPDNFHGGGPTNSSDGVSTPQQEKALAWYQEQYRTQNLDQYETVTVTGHSKGGNKAQYVTLEDETVSRCVSFDGQGFSDEFIEKKSSAIANRSDRITNHSSEGDYVNILLNSVGTQKYYKNNQESIKSGGFAENHCPNTFLHFDKNGNVFLRKSEQDKSVSDIDRFLNSYLRSLAPKDKAETLKTVGELVSSGMEGDFAGLTKTDIINNYLNDDRYRDKLVPLIGYMIRYQEEYPDTVESVKTILDGLGMGEAGDTVEKIMGYATNPLIRGLFRVDHDVLNNWITKSFVLNKMFEELGITSDEEKSILLNLINDIILSHDRVEKIQDGSDKKAAGAKRGKSTKRKADDAGGSNGNHDFLAATDRLNGIAVEMLQQHARLEGLERRLEAIIVKLDGSLECVKPAVVIQKRSLFNNRMSMNKMQEALKAIATEYDKTEKRIISG